MKRIAKGLLVLIAAAMTGCVTSRMEADGSLEESRPDRETVRIVARAVEQVLAPRAEK